jgi:hypothetical protein|tara:strand:+ start:6286 stop:7020 length:735 start_codon:yes stop_codon:yes gene_type:complete
MIKFAPDITIYNFEESNDILNEVIWVFSKNLKGVSTTKHRFTIHVIRDNSDEWVSLDGSIKSVGVKVSIKTFSNLPLVEKKLFLLDLITSCFLKVAQELNWNTESILKAKEDSLNQNLLFEYNSKPIWNLSKDKSASVEIILNKTKVSIYVTLVQKGKTDAIRKHLIDTVFWQVSDYNYFKKPKWFDDFNFGFEFENALTISVSIDEAGSIWSKSKSKLDDYNKYRLLFNENFSQKELARLANW